MLPQEEPRGKTNCSVISLPVVPLGCPDTGIGDPEELQSLAGQLPTTLEWKETVPFRQMLALAGGGGRALG